MRRWTLVFLVITWASLVTLTATNCGRSASSPVAPSPPPPVSSIICGVERWSVKTLADPDATRVDFINVSTTTISALNALPSHCSGLPDGRTYPEEFRVFEVEGVVQLTRNEDDKDVHIAVADPADASKTIVVEVADPACATMSPFLVMLTNAKSQYQSLGILTGRRVRIRGVGFYDFAHGQTGRSLSCIELHPVVSISAP
jgi:hypothetical protein